MQPLASVLGNELVRLEKGVAAKVINILAVLEVNKARQRVDADEAGVNALALSNRSAEDLHNAADLSATPS